MTIRDAEFVLNAVRAGLRSLLDRCQFDRERIVHAMTHSVGDLSNKVDTYDPNVSGQVICRIMDTAVLEAGIAMIKDSNTQWDDGPMLHEQFKAQLQSAVRDMHAGVNNMKDEYIQAEMCREIHKGSITLGELMIQNGGSHESEESDK